MFILVSSLSIPLYSYAAVFEVATQFNAIFRAQPQTKASASLLEYVDIQKSALSLNLLTIQLGSMEDLASAARCAGGIGLFFRQFHGSLGADFSTTAFEPKMRDLVVFWKEGAASWRKLSK
jgi:hypothetical protein